METQEQRAPPYRSSDDDRLKKETGFFDKFLAYLANWKDSINKRVGDFTPTDRNNMFLSQQTYEGLQMTVYSIKEVVPFLLENGLEYVLSEKFCQDDLENYFGRQRAIQRRRDNPDVRATLRNDNIIKCQYENKPIQGANCRPSKDVVDFDICSDIPLKKPKLE